jgi:hypothetical protein
MRVRNGLPGLISTFNHLDPVFTAIAAGAWLLPLQARDYVELGPASLFQCFTA